MNVLDEVRKESEQEFLYPDEKIASDIYMVSLSHTLRALAGISESEKLNKRKQEWEKANRWLEQETGKVHDIPVLDFDNIVKKLSFELHSCDAFFYNFEPSEGELHYLVEMKNTDSKNVSGKKQLLNLLKTDGKDSMYDKVRDSVLMIKNQLEFGGVQEHDEIIVHTHFFMVYSGKNDVPVRLPVSLPKKKVVDHYESGKQARAGRMRNNLIQEEYSAKREVEIYEDFGEKVRKLGLAACDESLFPGDALPRARKRKGEGKQRMFSIFSARDFAEIVDSGFFSEWKWGSYQKFFD